MSSGTAARPEKDSLGVAAGGEADPDPFGAERGTEPIQLQCDAVIHVAHEDVDDVLGAQRESGHRRESRGSSPPPLANPAG